MKGPGVEDGGVLKILKEGPETIYGSESEDEREAFKLAEEWLLEAKMPLEYRRELLSALIRLKERLASDGERLSCTGE